MTSNTSDTHENADISRILIVDDEPHICNALRRLFRADGHIVYATSDIKEALDCLEKETIDVVISDQRMPGCKGTEFLKQVQERRPATVRMILSGYSDVMDITQAMDAGTIYKFLMKPWDDSLLRANVREAVSRARELHRVRQESLVDKVTGFPTREHVRNSYRVFQSEAIERGDVVTLIAIRVDQLPSLFVAFGRKAGEDASRQLAAALTRELGAEWVLARGEEDMFLLLTKTSDPAERFEAARKHLGTIAATPIRVEGESIRLTLSIGCAFDSTNALPFDSLYDQTHAAVIAAEKDGGDTMRQFDLAQRRASRGFLKLEGYLREAVKANIIDVFYQPQIDLLTGSLVGIEALARWTHPELGSVSPGTFIPIAERLGLISQIGTLVMDRAVCQAAEWLESGLDFGRLAINVSPSQLPANGFVTELREILDRWGLAPERLVLEITETEVVRLSERVTNALRGLANLGIGLAIDDFGTGYANLSALSELPINKLKIDRSLVPSPNKGQRAARLFANIVAMANGLSLETLAEGIETPEELAAVGKAACRYVQGYLFSPPVSAGEVGRMLHARDDRDYGTTRKFRDFHIDSEILVA
jgi:diguanylate cyclase (GGDEF)-like protein